MSYQRDAYINQGDINIPFSACRQPTSATLLKSPCFSIYHYNQPCSSGYQTRTSSLLRGKRKSSSESTFHPRTKQQITEARIAASMQKLSLDNPFQGVGSIPSSSDRTQDEGFFDGVTDFTFEDDVDQEKHEKDESESLPQFKLAPGVKGDLDDMLNDILPKQIYKSMNQTCLALVPYVPPEIPIWKSSSPLERRGKSSLGNSNSGPSMSYEGMIEEVEEEDYTMVY